MTNQDKNQGFLSGITHWGVSDSLSPSFRKRIILTNLLGLMFTINMSVSGLAFLYYREFQLGVFTLAFTCSEFLWPVLNRRGRHTLSRVGLLISSNILGFIVSISLPGTGYNKGFYVMAGLPILLFGFREKGFMLLGLLLPLILYPLSEWSIFHVPAPFAIHLTPEMTITISYAIGVIYVALIFLMFYFLSRENDRAESALIDAVRRVEEEKRKIVELQAKAFASAKFAALGEMASGITHEINNPLTAINLHSQQLRFLIENGSDQKTEAMEKIDLVAKTVHRIARIVESMSTISREGSQDSMKEESLSRIVDDTSTFCAERFRRHNVDLRINVAKSIFVECRAVQISQLLLNLLNNAFDAIEDLPVKWIELSAVEKDSELIVSVTDSGSGIRSELREKIFDPFFTTKPAGKGTGLGLSLSRKIAQDHGGNLILDEKSPHTKFTLTLPRTC